MTTIINKHGEKEVQVTVRLPDELHEKVKQEARKTKSAKVVVIRRAVEKYFYEGVR